MTTLTIEQAYLTGLDASQLSHHHQQLASYKKIKADGHFPDCFLVVYADEDDFRIVPVDEIVEVQ